MTRYEKQFYETLINELPKISKELKEIKEQMKQKTINSTISSSLPKDKNIKAIMKTATDSYVSMMKAYNIDLKNKPEEVSNCCSEPVDENTDVCSKCGEHCEIINI